MRILDVGHDASVGLLSEMTEISIMIDEFQMNSVDRNGEFCNFRSIVLLSGKFQTTASVPDLSCVSIVQATLFVTMSVSDRAVSKRFHESCGLFRFMQSEFFHS